MTITYSDIEQHVTDGKKSAEIAEILAADPRMKNAIPLAPLISLMNFRRMLTKRLKTAENAEGWEGTVVNMLAAVNAGGAGDDVRWAVNQWFSHITYTGNSTFDLTNAQYAAEFAGMKAAFGGQPTMPTIADFEAIENLAGGRKTLGTVEELTAEVQTLIAAENQRVQAAATAAALDTARMELWQTWQDIYNQNISPVLDGTTPTVANLDAGIAAALAALRGE